jgi:hypothetical protein
MFDAHEARARGAFTPPWTPVNGPATPEVFATVRYSAGMDAGELLRFEQQLAGLLMTSELATLADVLRNKVPPPRAPAPPSTIGDFVDALFTSARTDDVFRRALKARMERAPAVPSSLLSPQPSATPRPQSPPPSPAAPRSEVAPARPVVEPAPTAPEPARMAPLAGTPAPPAPPPLPRPLPAASMPPELPASEAPAPGSILDQLTPEHQRRSARDEHPRAVVRTGDPYPCGAVHHSARDEHHPAAAPGPTEDASAPRSCVRRRPDYLVGAQPSKPPQAMGGGKEQDVQEDMKRHIDRAERAAVELAERPCCMERSVIMPKQSERRSPWTAVRV